MVMLFISSNNWEVPEAGAFVVLLVLGVMIFFALRLVKWWKK